MEALGSRAYPVNQWYVGALRSEIGDGILARTLLGRAVIFYRSDDGRVIAMAGRCPHRSYPLELGTRIRGGIRCGYHGLAFDDLGICRTRAHRSLPATMNVATFPVVEDGPLVWIWLGETRLADPASIPPTRDLGIGDPAWRFDAHGYLFVRARHGMLCDNLLDSTHIDFIHERSLERHTRGEDARAFAALLPGVTGPVDVVVSTQFRSPALIVAVRSQLQRQTLDGAPPERIAQMAFVHAVTPATATATHYFPFFTRDFRLDDDLFSAEIGARNMLVAREDQRAVEAIEASLAVTGDAPMDAPLPHDEIGLHARHRMATMIASESGNGVGEHLA
jgi:vanillate O-demethylase monooxygenase subunit